MKSTLFQIGIEAMFPQNVQHLSNSFYVTLAWVFGIDENIIQINNDKNVKLLSQELIDKTLEARRCIG